MTPLDALAGWRKTRHPRFAAIAQWATARELSAAPRPLVGAGKKRADLEAWNALLKVRDPLDLPRLIEALRKMKSGDAATSVTLLAKQNDPRFTDGALGLLRDPPWRARTALPFFRACARALQETGDPRVRPALEDLASRYKSIVETTIGDEIAALLRRTAGAIDQVKPGALPKALEESCAELERLFETERLQAQRGASSSRSAQASDEALLAAVYAAPDDDAPRRVFADALIERGDARGEFISLQLNRAAGKATPAQLIRERELCADPKKRAAWSLPLSQGGSCRLSRGFPDELLVEPRMLKTIIGLPAARTLKSVGGLEREMSLNQAKAFLLHENARNVRSVKMVPRELLEELEVAPWEEIALRHLPSADELARMPNLRSLHLWGLVERPGAALFAHLGKVEKLLLNDVDAPALSALTGLRELQVGPREVINWSPILSGLPRLERLTLLVAIHAGQVEGLKVKGLSCRYAPQFDANAVIGALPQLEELRVWSGGSTIPTAVTKLFNAPRLKQLKFASVDGYEVTAPFTPQGVLELRTWNRVDYQVHAGPVSTLPEGCVTKVLVRPHNADPWINAGPPPAEEAIAAIRAAAKVPVELAWY